MESLVTVAVLLLCVFSILKIGDCTGDLLAVVQVHRDCHRAPLLFYPNDPYNNRSVWSVPPGQLTQLGYQQCKSLGEFTRSRYVSFIPSDFSSSTFKARSINLHRCEISAQSVLQGIFSDNETAADIWYDEFPVESVDQRVFGAAPDCMIYSTELSNVLINGEWYYELSAEYAEVLEYVKESTGSKVQSVMGVYSLCDTLMCEETQGFELPGWTEQVYAQPLDLLGGYALKALSYTDLMKKLTVGAFFTKIIEYFEAVISGSTAIVYQLYSGETTNLVSIMNTLGVFNLTVPPFGSSFFIEMRLVDDVPVVNLWYKHGDTLDPLTVPCCAFDCPLETLKGLLGPFMLDTVGYGEECSSSSTRYTNLTDSSQSEELDDVHKECVVVINSHRREPLACTNEVLNR